MNIEWNNLNTKLSKILRVRCAFFVAFVFNLLGYDMFSRGFWDAAVGTKKTCRFYRSFDKPQERLRPVDGYAQRAYALRNGPWVMTEMVAEMNANGISPTHYEPGRYIFLA